MALTRRDVSQVIARQLMPRIMQGVQLDFFVRQGTTQTQFLLLMAIHAQGQCTMSQLARNMHVRMPTATGVVTRLVAAGFVRRIPHPTDRRQVIVTLTAKGRGFIREFQGVVRRRWEEVLRSLSATELAMFHRVVTKLTTRL
ncbi:MAG: MarR family transcriptional regulator [Candidatus Omnitrophica bacterium]|nr:MarR family transcriptional regulator [Candidatus Omnitrophota bacterium]